MRRVFIIVVFLSLCVLSVIPEFPVDVPVDILSERESISRAGDYIEHVWLDCPTPHTTRTIYQVAQKIVKNGVPVEIFEGVTVYIVPTKIFPKGTKNVADNAVGITTQEKEIWLAGRNEYIEKIFIHEVGHLFADRVFLTKGYNWSTANSLGWKYITLKDYPVENGLHWSFQQEMEWENRIAEWFAEDFQYYFCQDERFHSAGPKPTEEVLRFIEDLLETAETVQVDGSASL